MSSSSAASAAPSFSASSMSPVTEARSSAPSIGADHRAQRDAVDRAVRRRPDRRRRRPARRPARCSRPRARPAPRARRSPRPGWTRRRGRRRRAVAELDVRRPALHRQRALGGRGQHLQRVEQLGGLGDAARAGRSPAAATTTASSSPDAHLADPGVDVAADRHDLAGRGRARRAARCAAASRCRSAAPAGSSPSTLPSRATSASRGSSRCGTAASTAAGPARWAGPCRSARRRRPRRAPARRAAPRRTPRRPAAATGADERSPDVLISTSSQVCPAARSRSATIPVWAMASALGRVPMRNVMRSCPLVRSRRAGPPARRARRRCAGWPPRPGSAGRARTAPAARRRSCRRPAPRRAA